MAASDATPIPEKNVAYRVTFPIFDADGDLVTAAASLDSEVSKDGGTFSDCTNEATEIATSSGMYYLDLTATEMNADTVAIIIKTTTTDAKTTPIVLYPEEDGDLDVNVTQVEGSDATNQIRDSIVDDATRFSGANIDAAITSRLAPTTSGRTLDVTTTGEAGIDLDNVNGTLGAAEIATDAITADKIAANAITSSELADGAITAAKFGAGAIDATAIATDAIDADAIAANAIGASELATDAVNEIVDQTWDEAVADHVTVGSYGHLMRGLLAADGTVESNGGNSTTQLQTDLAEATDDHYIGDIIVFTDGDNAGIASVITDYTGSTGTLVFSPAVIDTASVGEKFIILGTSAFADVRSWLSTAVTTSATTAKPEVDINSVSDDAGAANNLEADYDGTGYNKSASTIGTATALGTDAVDATSLANDAITAAKIAADAIGASELAADAATEIRDAVTGGAYALDTDANGRVRVVDGTGAGEIDTASGRVQITEAQIDQIVDETWDEALSGHTTLATFGQIINALGARTGAVNDVGALATDFDVDGFTEASDDHFNGHTLVFTSGALTGQGRVISDYTGSGQNIVFERGFTEAPANNDEFVIFGPLAGVLSRVVATESDGHVHADVKEIEGTDATDQINTEVSDVLKTDTIAEQSQGVPPTTPTFEQAVMFLYSALVNRVDVNTTGGTDYKEFYNRAETMLFRKAVSDDGSTYSEDTSITGV